MDASVMSDRAKTKPDQQQIGQIGDFLDPHDD